MDGERKNTTHATTKSIGSSVRSSLGLDCAEASTAAEHQICASGTNDTVYVTTRHALATVAHRALRSDRFLTWQRPDSPISDVGAMQEGRVRKSLLQGGRWLEVCLRRRPSACGVAKLAAVKNRGPGRGKRPFQAWSAWRYVFDEGPRKFGSRGLMNHLGRNSLLMNLIPSFRCVDGQDFGRFWRSQEIHRDESEHDSLSRLFLAFERSRSDEDWLRW